MFATLSGEQKFTKLEEPCLSSDCVRCRVQEICHREYLQRDFYLLVLLFGVSSSPSIFQRTIEGVLRGLQHGAVFLDDILVTGHNDKEHLQTLARALDRLQEAGLQLKRSKCTFMEN